MITKIVEKINYLILIKKKSNRQLGIKVNVIFDCVNRKSFEKKQQIHRGKSESNRISRLFLRSKQFILDIDKKNSLKTEFYQAIAKKSCHFQINYCSISTQR